MLEEMLEMYQGTTVEAPVAQGLSGHFGSFDGDCNCLDCGDDSNCGNCD